MPEGAQHDGCLRQALPNSAEDSRDTGLFQGLHGRIRKERAFHTWIGRLKFCTIAQDSLNPQSTMPEGGRASREGNLHQSSPEAAAGMRRLEAEQDPGPARLKDSQNPAAPAESPINTVSLIKIAPDAEKLHQPQCRSRAGCS